MSPSLIISIVAVIISAAAVGVSIWTHIRSHTLQKRIVALEETREKDRVAEKQKASLTAHIVKDLLTRGNRSTDQYYLAIKNTGLGQARNIQLKVDGQKVTEHPCFLNGTKEVTVIGPESFFRYVLNLTTGTPLPSKADIIWEDDSGEPGKYTTTLTL